MTFEEKMVHFRVGVRVYHPIRGTGTVVDIVHDDERGKPYVVQYDDGTEHRYGHDYVGHNCIGHNCMGIIV